MVTLEAFSEDGKELLARVQKLEERVGILTTLLRLVFALLRISGFRLSGERLPEGQTKSAVLSAIASAKRTLPLAVILKILRLAPSRYHAWRRAAEGCGLEDRTSCPRTMPNQLAADEIGTIKDMVLDPNLRHMPLRTLSLYAQRVGKVWASVSTWGRLIRERGWRRPRMRVHPEKPTLGIRATRPNELWHIDVTILKLLDGTKAYIHAVIDNYSRKILAWAVDGSLNPATTCEVLVAAGRHLKRPGAERGATANETARPPADGPIVYSDSGVENVNHLVAATLLAEGLRLVLAQVEVTYSNSMIEAWWRSLKHGWLYLNSLDTIERVRQLVTFYVESHNTEMPHSAFRGHTPDERYFGKATNLEEELAAARGTARERRLEVNRGASCRRCEPGTGPPDRPGNTE